LLTIDVVYLASMFDHRGGVFIQKTLERTPPKYRMDIIFTNRDSRAMREFRDKLNYAGTIRRDGNSWRWVISSTAAIKMLDLIGPHIRLKNDQIELAFRFLRTVESPQGRGIRLSRIIMEEREICYQKMKIMKEGYD
jgi:hypothetical protein